MHDLARVFVASRLDVAASDFTQQRHAEHYKKVLSLANEVFSQGKGDFLEGLQLFDLEKLNILAGQPWAEKNQIVNSSANELCEAYATVGVHVLDLRLTPDQMVPWLELGLEATRRSKDKVVEGVLLGNLGNAYVDLGDPRKAIEYYEQALKIAREIGDRRGEGNSLGNLGSAYAELSEPRKAIEHYEQQLKITQEIGDLRGEGNALWNMSLVQDSLGKRSEAVKLANDALAIFEQIESPYAERMRQQLAEWQG